MKSRSLQFKQRPEADSGQGPVTQMSSFVRPEAFALVKQMQQIMAPLGVAAGDNNAYPPGYGCLAQFRCGVLV